MEVETSTKAEEPKKQGRFKIVGKAVIAMNRFMSALNPEYTYTKKSQQQHAPVLLTAASAREKRSSSGRTLSGRTSDNAGKHHGYKGNILLKSLPPSEQETTA